MPKPKQVTKRKAKQPAKLLQDPKPHPKKATEWDAKLEAKPTTIGKPKHDPKPKPKQAPEVPLPEPSNWWKRGVKIPGWLVEG